MQLSEYGFSKHHPRLVIVPREVVAYKKKKGVVKSMSINGKAYIAGVYEHPTRKAVDKSLAQLHAESALGALADAGLTKDDVDGYFCAGDAPDLAHCL